MVTRLLLINTYYLFYLIYLYFINLYFYFVHLYFINGNEIITC